MTELKIEKEKVLELAKSCPEWKEGLKTLFPQAFEKENKIDWSEVYNYPFKHILIKNNDRIDLSPELKSDNEIYRSHLWPCITLGMLRDFCDLLLKKHEENTKEN